MACQYIITLTSCKRENNDGELEELAVRCICQETFICVIFGKKTRACSRFFVDLLIWPGVFFTFNTLNFNLETAYEILFIIALDIMNCLRDNGI